LDSEGVGCLLCGGAPGFRDEQCYVTEETKAKLRAHSEELKTLGVTLEEIRPLQKDAGVKIAAISLALAVAESLHPNALRHLVLFLRDIAIPKEEILRLRLDEPEQVSEVLKHNEHDERKKVG
jgi:hypothetical protein